MKGENIGFVLVLAALTYGCASTDRNDQVVVVQSGGEPAAAVTSAESQNDPSDPDAVTCKVVQKTGTRFRSRVCATNREWQMNEDKAEKAVSEIQRKGALGRQ